MNYIIYFSAFVLIFKLEIERNNVAVSFAHAVDCVLEVTTTTKTTTKKSVLISQILALTLTKLNAIQRLKKL